VQQVTALVRWRECVEYMRDEGTDTIVEIGAGKVLSGLVRRIDRDLKSISVSTPGDIEDLVKSL
jgi:[acyl-carrier-protein] S-malonyltransferase